MERKRSTQKANNLTTIWISYFSSFVIVVLVVYTINKINVFEYFWSIFGYFLYLVCLASALWFLAELFVAFNEAKISTEISNCFCY